VISKFAIQKTTVVFTAMLVDNSNAEKPMTSKRTLENF